MTKPVRFPTTPAARNGFGTAALALGIIGATAGLVPLLGLVAIVLGLLALVFGLLGWSNVRRYAATNRGIAVSGTILGVVALTLGIWGTIVLNQAAADLDRELHELDRELPGAPLPTSAT